MRGIVYGLLFSMILNLTGCLAMKKAYVAIHDSIDEALTNAPAILTNVTTGAQTPSAGTVDVSGDLVDPQPDLYNAVTLNYKDESRRNFISSCECSIEPATGLFVRCPVWVPSIGGWYYLSDPFKSGRIRLEGSKSNGTLICEPFVLAGATWECVGSTDHEIDTRKGEDLEWLLKNLKTKGNRIPYSAKRVYLVWVCHKL